MSHKSSTGVKLVGLFYYGKQSVMVSKGIWGLVASDQ